MDWFTNSTTKEKVFYGFIALLAIAGLIYVF
jgi:hypothetical protein